MSISSCVNCGDIYDTDFQMEVNKKGDCVCDNCSTELGGDNEAYKK